MKRIKKILRPILAVAFVISLGMALWQVLQYNVGQQSNDQAQLIAFSNTIPETVSQGLAEIPDWTVPLSEKTPELPWDESAKFLQEINVWGLRQINPDVLGWLYIPNTVISYPLMQTDEQAYYLHTSWDNKYSKSGSIFLEEKNSRDLTDFNTIIYGHHMANGSMFGTLKYFKDQSFTEEHRLIYVCTADRIFRYEIFSVYDAPIDSDTYRLYFADEVAKQKALDHFNSSNLLDLGLEAQPEDQILTLSTCTGTGVYTSRIVVQAVLTGQWKK